MQSDKSLAEDFDQFIYSRLERPELMEHSDDYRTRREKSLHIYETMQAMFPENKEFQKSLMDLADSYAGMQGDFEKCCYKLGFTDGVTMMFSVLVRR